VYEDGWISGERVIHRGPLVVRLPEIVSLYRYEIHAFLENNKYEIKRITGHLSVGMLNIQGVGAARYRYGLRITVWDSEPKLDLMVYMPAAKYEIKRYCSVFACSKLEI